VIVYVVVVCPADEAPLVRLRAAVAKPWLQVLNREARYWVGTLEDAEHERALLALAGFSSQIEPVTFDP
jgi:hypothetical protein